MISESEQLGISNADHTRRLWLNMNRKGWRTHEPLDDELQPEVPRLLRRSVKMLVEEGIKRRDQIIFDLRRPASDLEDLMQLPTAFSTAWNLWSSRASGNLFRLGGQLTAGFSNSQKRVSAGQRFWTRSDDGKSRRARRRHAGRRRRGYSERRAGGRGW
jgi:hypothetical protein